MKRLINSLVFLFLIFGLSGCYTILETVEECNETPNVIVYYPVPVPVPTLPSPPPISPPVSPIIPLPIVPNPPVHNPEPQPILRQPESPNNGQGSGNPVRDPLRDHGGRGNGDRNTQGRK